MNNDLISFLTGVVFLIIYLVFSALTEMGTKLPWKKSVNNKMQKEENNKLNQKNIDYWDKVVQAPTPAYQELFIAEKKYILQFITENALVLDIACGKGRIIESILDKTQKVYGIDNDFKAVQDTKERFQHLKSVKIFLANANNLPFENETFNFITFMIILTNLDDQKQSSMLECTRVLKKGGKMILSTYSDTAFEERMKIYKKINVPIKNIENTKVIFDETVGANVSEQFSEEDLKNLGKEVGLSLIESQKVGELAFICVYEK